MSLAMKPVKVLLMAGGLGTRLRPLTDNTPKCLINVAGRPLMDYWLDAFVAAGLFDILINTHHLRPAVCDYINSTTQFGWAGHPVRMTEAFEPVLLGSAGTIHANRAWADDAEHIVVVYADNLSNVSLQSLLAFHTHHGDPVTMMLFRTEAPERCGIADLDADMRVVKFIEKPSHPTSNLANAGVYVVRADAFREIADMAVFDIGTDVLPKFVGRMYGWEWPGYHRDIGTHTSLELANLDVAQGNLEAGYRRQVNWSPAK